jgi:tetratricopeptide (TPR) repeat protein
MAKVQRKSRGLTGNAESFIGFGPESATAVPRLQRPFSRVFRNAPWSLGRTLRVLLPTLALGLTVLVSHPAHAQTQTQEPWARRLARSHYERALVFERRDDIAQALREYTEALAIDSTLGEAYLNLGAIRERMGDPREAELVYSEAVRLSDTRARALLQRSHLRRQAGLAAQALADLEASVELDPSPAALRELSHHYVEAHAWSAALATVRRLAYIAQTSGDAVAYESARLEVRALRILAAEVDPSTQRAARHDWVARALISIARR